jgi:hypothetical protein
MKLSASGTQEAGCEERHQNALEYTTRPLPRGAVWVGFLRSSLHKVDHRNVLDL